MNDGRDERRDSRAGGTTVDPGLRHWGAGIFSIDSGYVRHEFDAIHLVLESDRAALIDSGTVHSLPRVLAALEILGIPRDNVDWVMLTHVHLDHAGGAGALLRALPNARLTVHPRGARHMIDPSRLWQATVAVYGQKAAEQAYGEIVPIAAERVVETPEGTSVTLAGRTFQFIDTPGHARHHVAIRDSATGHLFTGDVFGISYRDLDVGDQVFIIPSTTPTQFEPDAMLQSLERLLALEAEAVYLTHYAQRRDVARLGARLKRLLAQYQAIALAAQDAECSPTAAAADIRASLPALQARIGAGLQALYRDELRALGSPLSDAEIAQVLAMDITLNTDGLIDWLCSRASGPANADAGAVEAKAVKARAGPDATDSSTAD